MKVNVFDRDKLEVIDVVRMKKELCSRKPLIAYCKLRRLAELDVVKEVDRRLRVSYSLSRGDE